MNGFQTPGLALPDKREIRIGDTHVLEVVRVPGGGRATGRTTGR